MSILLEMSIESEMPRAGDGDSNKIAGLRISPFRRERDEWPAKQLLPWLSSRNMALDKCRAAVAKAHATRKSFVAHAVPRRWKYIGAVEGPRFEFSEGRTTLKHGVAHKLRSDIDDPTQKNKRPDTE